MKKLTLFLIPILLLIGCQKNWDENGLNYNIEIPKSSQNSQSVLPADIKSNQKFVPNQLLVKFRNGMPDQIFLRQQNSVVVEKVLTAAMKSSNYSGFHILMVPDVSKAAEAFKRNPNVEWANPNYIVTHDAFTPNDPYYTNGNLWGMGNIKTPTAWNTNTGDQKVYIGVIDEGIMYFHEDLCGQIWDNPYETENGKDDDGNGYIDDMHGYDFMHMDNTIFDNADNHGTHVSGTIGGKGNNGKGVIGVSPNVTIISGKFLEGSGSTADAVKAIDYMTDLKVRHGMNIAATSNSWGGGGYDQALYDAINRARLQDILFVAAAGNNGNNTDVTPNYPSCYNLDNIISVAAYDVNEALPYWTNYGLTTVDIGAPGVSILSTLPGTAGASTYDYYSGTSMATPHVSGAVALYKAGNPTAKYTDVKNAILNNARPIAALNGKCVTGGVLNVSTFIQPTTNQQVARGCVVPAIDYVAPTAPSNVQLVSKDSVNRTATISWTPSTDNIGVTKYVISVDNTFYISATTVSGTSTSVTLGGLSSGAQYSSRLVAYDAWGNASPTTSYTIVLGYDVTPPTTPGNFKVAAYDATSVSFSYDWSTDNWSGIGLYRINYRVASCTTCAWRDWNTNNVNPLKVPNLTTGTQYAFTIAAMDNNRNWSPESPVVLETPRVGPDVTPPSAPINLNATKTSNSIYPYWTASTDNVGVVGYDVYYKKSTDVNFTLFGSTPNTLLNITGLLSSTTYNIYVVAKDAAGNISTPSSTITVTTDAGADVNSPTQPTNLSATSTSNSISLSWTPSTDNVGVTYYNVYYKASSNSTYLLYGSPTSNSTNITGLTSNTSYDMYVTAKDAAGNTSIPSTTLTKSTAQISYTISTSLAGTIQQKNTHKLSWSGTVTPSGFSVKSVQLQWLVNSVWTTLTTSTSLSGSYTQKVLDKTSKQYRVVTTLNSGEVGYSNIVSLISK